MTTITLGFDLGKASLGLCARTDEAVLALRAIEIPPTFAATDDFRDRRRFCRTRKAHKAREAFFMERVWLAAGLPDYRQPAVWEALKASLPGCYGRDKKLWTREFPAKVDQTVFNSALLRIQLIEGVPLAEWQIWRALWSALQKRGFHYYKWKNRPSDLLDVDLDGGVQALIEKVKADINSVDAEIDEVDQQIKALKAKPMGKIEKTALKPEIDQLEDDKKALKQKKDAWVKDEEYKQLLKDLPKLEKFQEAIGKIELAQYRYPCYMEAHRLGLWDLDEQYRSTTKKDPRIDGYVVGKDKDEQLVPRIYRMKELRILWEQACKQLPALAALNKSADYFLFGETEQPYATVGWDQSKPSVERFRVMQVRGRAELDWQGVLGQKVPRFDNRIIAKCQLFPSRNVCNAKDELNIRFSLLTQLKNLTVKDHAGTVRGLSPDEFGRAWATLWALKNASYEVSATVLAKVAKAALPGCDGFYNLANREKLQAKIQGRSRFCRRALTMMTDILLNGWNPPEVDPQRYVDQPKNGKQAHPEGFKTEEVEKALRRLGASWMTFQVMDDRDEAKQKAMDLIAQCTDTATGEINQVKLKRVRHEAVQKLVASSNNPIVRNRLMIFYRELAKLDQYLQEEHGLDVATQGRVIIEFIRTKESLLSQESMRNLQKVRDENTKRNTRLAGDLAKYSLAITKQNIIKAKLFEEQRGMNAYPNLEPLTDGNAWDPYNIFEKLDFGKLESYEIEHIVPRSDCFSSDSQWNLVLTTHALNQAKGNDIPYDWFRKSRPKEWEGYFAFVSELFKNNKKKRELLTSPEARQKVENWNGLAETGYIARLAQKIVALHFGWGLQTKKIFNEEGRKVFISNGSETAAVRKGYDLSKYLLNDKERSEYERLLRAYEQEFKKEEKDALYQRILPYREKNRKDTRHHALDAFCISWSQDVLYKKKSWGSYKATVKPWENNIENKKQFLFQFEKHIQDLFVPVVRRSKADLSPNATFYSRKTKGSGEALNFVDKKGYNRYYSNKYMDWRNFEKSPQDHFGGLQLKESKSNRGNYIYCESQLKRKSWKVWPVYTFMKKSMVDELFLNNSSYEKYLDPFNGKPIFLYPSLSIKTQKDVENLKAGKYTVRGIESDGRVSLTQNVSASSSEGRYRVTINALVKGLLTTALDK
jgi:RuvC endonuclease subdomain 3/HNH endonuclease